MAPIIISFVGATFFGLGSTLFLGPENLVAHPWVDTTVWALLATGVLVSTLQYVRESWIRSQPVRQPESVRVNHQA